MTRKERFEFLMKEAFGLFDMLIDNIEPINGKNFSQYYDLSDSSVCDDYGIYGLAYTKNGFVPIDENNCVMNWNYSEFPPEAVLEIADYLEQKFLNE